MKDLKELKIGLAMSGGGLRATVFHLGVLSWLAEKELLENVTRLSTVAGGSLCAGLVFACCNNQWPSSEQFAFAKGYLRKAILENDLQKLALQKLVWSPQYWNTKANLLGNLMNKQLGMNLQLSELPNTPRWYINCTTHETGKRFRFTQTDMGDYVVGYTDNPNITMGDAVAASTGFPVLMGSYGLDVTRYKWERSASQTGTFRDQGGTTLHLWEGSICDSLGLEPIFNMEESGQLADGLDFMVISSATGSGALPKPDGKNSGMKRLLDIATEQASGLRRKVILRHMEEHRDGMFLCIGNSADYIAKQYQVPDHVAKEVTARCMSTSEAWRIRKLPVGLGALSSADYDTILRHGYEVADCTYTCIFDRMQEMAPKAPVERLLNIPPADDDDPRRPSFWKVKK